MGKSNDEDEPKGPPDFSAFINAKIASIIEGPEWMDYQVTFRFSGRLLTRGHEAKDLKVAIITKGRVKP